MTERPAGSRAAATRPHVVAWTSVCAFLAVLTVLAYEMRQGRDPLLHATPIARQAAPTRVLLRKIVKRVVVVRVIPAPVESAGGSAAAASGGGGGAGLSVSSAGAPAGGGSYTASAPQAASSAPATSAPAPAPAPAAPAPVTRSS